MAARRPLVVSPGTGDAHHRPTRAAAAAAAACVMANASSLADPRVKVSTSPHTTKHP